MKRPFAALAVLAGLLLQAAVAHAALREQEVEYQSGGTVLKGYLTWDDSITGKRPGVIVVHEWWGLNDYARKRARMLAELGYTAFAADMYGDGKSTVHPQEATAFMNAAIADPERAKKRFLAAQAVLQRDETVDPTRIAAIGYCFGGATVLEMARQGADLDAVVSFHGALGTKNPAQPGAVKARLLVENGAADPLVSSESVAAFKQEMDAAGVNYRFDNYPGAVHSFTNPDADRLGKETGMPLAYNAAADQQSWAAMQALFKDVFGQ